MATDAIISDAGAIYKRLFHHRPVIQNEVHFFVRELETKRGNSDLQCLQSCVSMVSEMEAVFLEDITAMRPSFKAIHNLSDEVSELCSGILKREREGLTISSSEQAKLDQQVVEYQQQLVDEHTAFEAEYREESARLSEEIRLAHESRMRLQRTVSVGSSAGLSLSNNGSTTGSLELSREGGGEGEGGEAGEDGERGRGDRGREGEEEEVEEGEPEGGRGEEEDEKEAETKQEEDCS